MQKRRLRNNWLESSFTEKDMEDQEAKLKTNQQRALAASWVSSVLDCVRKHLVSRSQGRWILPL